VPLLAQFLRQYRRTAIEGETAQEVCDE
jgi:hypothetical protein